MANTKESLPAFIVGEVSKNWEFSADRVAYDPGRDGPLVSGLFEHMINTNLERGYELHSFQVNRILDAINETLNETIIAVFKRV